MTEKLNKKEYKTFSFEVKKFYEDEKYFHFEGYLSTYGNIDRGGDVVNKGAFTESLKEHQPALFWSHKTDEPLGIFPSITDDKIGLYVHGKMPKKDVLVSGRIIPQMEIGSIKSMSIGFSVYEGGSEMIDGVRHLNKLYLWEGSLVTIPMNDRASVKTKSAMSIQNEIPIADRQAPWNSYEAYERVKEWAGAKDGGLNDKEIQDKFKKAFLWHDEETMEESYSYEFLIADIIGGTLTIIPRAIFSAAASIQSTKYPVYLPLDDINGIIKTLSGYYKKMGLDSPFDDKKAFRVDAFDALDERSMEKLFCTGIKTSRKHAKMLVSFVKSGLARGEAEEQREVVQKENKWDEVLESLKSIK